MKFSVFLIPFLAWLLALFVLPQLDLLKTSFTSRGGGFTFANYIKFFATDLYRNVFIRTILYSILATFLTFILAFPAALFLTKFISGRKRIVLITLVVGPFWISELIQALTWMVLLRETGVLNTILRSVGLLSHNVEFLYNIGAVMVGLVYSSMLFMIIPIISVLQGLDDSLIEAAYDLGGSFWRIVGEIIIPYAAPGIVSGCVITFMIILGNIVTVTLLGGKGALWFSQLIYDQFLLRFNWGQGAAFGVILLIASVVFVWIFLKITKQDLTEVV